MVRTDKFRALRIYWSLLLLGCWSLGSIAQNDTITLDEVLVESTSPEFFIPGASHHKINTDSLTHQNLAELLSSELPLYFVNYGAPGQLSSINLRGLGASRTTLRWQGMEINSFSLGQSDYGTLFSLPGYGIKVGLGPGAAVYGNGAIGGAISLDHIQESDPGIKLRLGQSYGSFGNYGIQAGMELIKERWSWSGIISQGGARNNFPYEREGSRVRQINAGFQNTNLAQNLYFKPGSNHSLSSHIWYTRSDREIQPSRQQRASDEELENRNFRSLVHWLWTDGSVSGSTKLGFTRDHQIYNRTNRVLVDRWFAAYEMDWALPKWDIKAGTQWNHLVARVDAFEGIIKENRNDLYVASRWRVSDGLQLGLNIRAPLVDGEIKTLAPLASLQYQLPWNTQSTRLSWDLQVGRSYLIPTLNQRFWQPGGNPDLKPETSLNWETGIDGEFKSPKLVYQAKIRYFQHQVKDWIIWIPGGSGIDDDGNTISFWYPDNLRKVLARGFEFHQQAVLPFPGSKWRQSLTLNGTYQRAENKRSLSSLDRGVNKQLPYTPQWVLLASWQTDYEDWSAGLGGQFVTERFIETNNELPPLEQYTLWRVNAGTRGKWGQIEWSLALVINNLFDTDYENFENRAMPGRNYNLNLLLTY